MRRLLLGLLISSPLYAQVPSIEFNCEFDGPPREKCTLKAWSHTPPNLGLEDMGLPKQVTYVYQGTPKHQCSGMSVNLEISVAGTSTRFELKSPNTFVFTVYGSPMVTITDTNPEKTSHLSFNNSCIGTFDISQGYSEQTLSREAKNIKDQLTLVMDNITGLKQYISYLSLTDDERSQKIADLQLRITTLEATVKDLTGVTDLSTIIEKLKDAETKLKEIQGLDKNQKEKALQDSQSSLESKKSIGRLLVDNGIKIMRFLTDDELNKTITNARQGI